MEYDKDFSKGVAERSPLFSNRGISLHFEKVIGKESFTLESYEEADRIFKENPLIYELWKLGCPLKTLNSFLRCQEKTDFIIKKCGCGKIAVPISHHCDLRNCPLCALRRKIRNRNRLLPYLRNYPIEKSYDFYLLTISPDNYTSLKEGLEEILDSFSKLRRNKYFAERIKGGFYVIEVVESDFGTWNIHLHIILYSRRLDNRIRGQCLDCGQSLMNFNKEKKEFYCANKKCNSTNVIVKKNSKIVSIAKRCFKREVNIRVDKLSSINSTINYLLKYVSSNKEDFKSLQSMAQYIMAIRHKRLINVFGCFFKDKIPPLTKKKQICPKCNQEIEFYYDSQETYDLLNPRTTEPPPNLEEINYEVIKIRGYNES